MTSYSTRMTVRGEPRDTITRPTHVSVAQPAVMPSSDHAKKAKFVCNKCGVRFGRWDTLRRHVRNLCSHSSRSSSCSRSRRENTTTYMCKKCGRNFNTRKDMFRQTRTACGDVNEPQLPKISKWEHTTPPLVTEENPIEPPARRPFSDTLSKELLDVVGEHWSTIRTRVSRGPVQCKYDYRVTTLDMTVLEAPLKIMFQEQTHSFKINLSYGFVLRNKNTGRCKYYLSSCNCCGRYLDEPSLITNSKDFDAFLKRIRETEVLQRAINQRPDSAWVCELVTNVNFFVNRIIDHPIGFIDVTLPAYLKKNKDVIDLEKEPIHSKRYNDSLCLFRCMALHRGGDVRRLEPAVKTLYEAYDQDDIAMEDFAGFTPDDLYRVETHFSYIQDVRMWGHSYRYLKCGDLLHRHERTCEGVSAETIRVACTTRPHQCS